MRLANFFPQTNFHSNHIVFVIYDISFDSFLLVHLSLAVLNMPFLEEYENKSKMKTKTKRTY